MGSSSLSRDDHISRAYQDGLRDDGDLRLLMDGWVNKPLQGILCVVMESRPRNDRIQRD